MVESFPHQDYSLKTLQLASHHEEICIRLSIVLEIQTICNFYTAIILHIITLCISLSHPLPTAPSVC